MIIDSIKEGILLTNRNWQVILLRIAVTIINITGLIILVGIPVFIAAASLGVDMAQAENVILEFAESPVDIVSHYSGMILFVLFCFLLYITAASVLIIYAFGGMLGVLKNAALSRQYKFSFSSFLNEARKYFMPFCWLLTLASLIILAVMIVFGILIALVVTIGQGLGGSGSSFLVFLSSFITLLIIFLTVLSVIGSVIYTSYACISLTVDNEGVMASFRKAWEFIMGRPVSFLFYIILIVCIFVINIVLMVFGFAFQTIPVVGVVFYMPYQLIYYAVQCYLAIVMWASLVAFYRRGTGRNIQEATYDI